MPVNVVDAITLTGMTSGGLQRASCGGGSRPRQTSPDALRTHLRRAPGPPVTRVRPSEVTASTGAGWRDPRRPLVQGSSNVSTVVAREVQPVAAAAHGAVGRDPLGPRLDGAQHAPSTRPAPRRRHQAVDDLVGGDSFDEEDAVVVAAEAGAAGNELQDLLTRMASLRSRGDDGSQSDRDGGGVSAVRRRFRARLRKAIRSNKTETAGRPDRGRWSTPVVGAE